MGMNVGVKAALKAQGAAPIFASRAWVNFNGTGTVAINASGNVSSITDNGVGDYSINFAAAMPTSYTPTISYTPDFALFSGLTSPRLAFIHSQSASAVRVITGYQAPAGSAAADYPNVNVNITC